jgi:raffinose/stachyose/melibiose transport system permease protein/N-acetylglucosamine transport system permease protein
MSGARGGGFRVSRLLVGGALAGYLGWVVFPLVWVVYSSFKDDTAILREPLALPAWAEIDGAAYARAWSGARLGEYFLNSALVTTASVALILALGSMAAYALARFYHPLGRAAHTAFLAGLMIPAQLAMVPLFFELRALGLLDSKWGLILVYAANGLPFAVFILAGFFRGLPRTLHEAAVVDGCTEAQAFWRVMLPLARPGLVTVAIFQFIGIWKEYFFAFMLVGGGGAEAKTLPLGLANLAITAQYRSDYGMLFAGIVIVTLPILAIYLLLQAHLVRGITAGALKG